MATESKRTTAKPKSSEKPAPKPTYYLSPYGDKGWKIMKRGGVRVTKVFKTKKEALEYSRTLCKNQEAVIFIQRKDGSFQDVKNYRDE